MFIFCTDIDGTIYQNEEHAELFRRFWDGVSNEKDENGRSPVLVYNTGRSLENCRLLLEECCLPEPDYIIGGVGTEIYDMGKGEDIDAWGDELHVNWDVDKVSEVVSKVAEGVTAQPEDCQNEYKSSWFWHDKLSEELELVSEALDEAGLAAQVIYSSNRDMDVIPKLANKGNAAKWLVGRLGRDMSELVVAGDSGNDVSMFQLEGVRGIMPLNAEHTLRDQVDFDNVYDSPGVCAEGIVHGLRTFVLGKDNSNS